MTRRRRWRSPSQKYLPATCELRVRFQEVDSLRVAWHGHYLTYLEEGRNAFGRQYGFGYKDILDAGYIAPLVHVELDYLHPARFDQLLEIETRMHLVEGASITFTYQVADQATGTRLAEARSDQAFTDLDGNLVLTRPAFQAAFFDRWTSQMQEL